MTIFFLTEKIFQKIFKLMKQEVHSYQINRIRYEDLNLIALFGWHHIVYMYV